MTAAIIFATSHGTTAKVAKLIQSELGQNIQVFNLKETKTIDLSQFELIVIGGSIHAGQIQGIIKKFCKQNMVELLNKRIALFLCAMNKPDYEKEFVDAYPELLRKHSFANTIVGGEFNFDRMNWFERLIVRKISGISQSVSKIDDDNIKVFADRIKMQPNI